MNRRVFSASMLTGLLGFAGRRGFASSNPPAKPEYTSELCGAVIRIKGEGYTEHPGFTGIETDGDTVIEQFMFNRGGEGNLKIWFVKNGPAAEEVFADRYAAMSKQSAFTELESGEAEEGAWWTGGIQQLDVFFGLYGEWQPERFEEIDVYVEWGSQVEHFDENLKDFAAEITIDDAEVLMYLEESGIDGDSYSDLQPN